MPPPPRLHREINIPVGNAGNYILGIAELANLNSRELNEAISYLRYYLVDNPLPAGPRREKYEELYQDLKERIQQLQNGGRKSRKSQRKSHKSRKSRKSRKTQRKSHKSRKSHKTKRRNTRSKIRRN